MKFRKVAPARK